MAVESPNCYVCDHHTLCYARRHVDDLVKRSGLFNENWQQLFVTLAKACKEYRHEHRFERTTPMPASAPGYVEEACECGERRKLESL